MKKYVFTLVFGLTILGGGRAAQAGGGPILWQWPISNPEVLSYWHHRGTDLIGQSGEAVYPVFQGRVIKATCNGRADYGCYVVLQHYRYDVGENGTYFFENYRTVYAQLQDINVQVDEEVNTDTVLGIVGTKWHKNIKKTKPHVHFEIRYNDGKTHEIIKGWKYRNYIK